jgi:hypothetical protein
VTRPTWIAFDLNGTLLDPGALLGAGREEMGRVALDDAVMQAMADTLTGEHRPFPSSQFVHDEPPGAGVTLPGRTELAADLAQLQEFERQTRS